MIRTIILFGIFFFAVISGSISFEAADACADAKAVLARKMAAIDVCVSSGLCAPTLADFENVYYAGDQVKSRCEEE